VNALDCGKVVCTAFLDLRKVFNSLDHFILLHRLSELVVLGNELNWFINYLSYCLQCVKLNGKVSDWTREVSPKVVLWDHYYFLSMLMQCLLY